MGTVRPQNPHFALRRRGLGVLGRIQKEGIAVLAIELGEGAEQRPGVPAITAAVVPAGGIDGDAHS